MSFAATWNGFQGSNLCETAMRMPTWELSADEMQAPAKIGLFVFTWCKNQKHISSQPLSCTEIAPELDWFNWRTSRINLNKNKTCLTMLGMGNLRLYNTVSLTHTHTPAKPVSHGVLEQQHCHPPLCRALFPANKAHSTFYSLRRPPPPAWH